MKTCLYTICAIVLGTSVSFSQEKPEGPGGPGKGKHPKPAEVFTKLDADANGSVSLEEFKKSHRAQKNPAKAEEIFKKIDADSNGGISLEEFKAHKPPHGPGKVEKPKGDKDAPPPAE
jgi:EF-hand domain pair